MLFSDPAAERGVLAGIFKFGNEAFLEVSDIVDSNTFTVDSNQLIYKCISQIYDKHPDAKLDLPSVFSAAKELGIFDILNTAPELKHLKAVMVMPVEFTNLRRWAAKLRKLSIAKTLHQKEIDAQTALEQIRGDEPLEHIIGIAEAPIFEFLSEMSISEGGPQTLGSDIFEYIDYLCNNVTDYVGISTPFPIFDSLIGGGLRRKSVNVIGAPKKTGKTTFAINVASHVAGTLNIPVLVMDTEMSKEDYYNKMLSLHSQIPTFDVERGKFASVPFKRQRIIEAGNKIKNMQFDYVSVSGRGFDEILSIMRRWVLKRVGIDENGKTQDCLIIYDYLKLMTSEGISDAMKEYQIFGFLMTSLHNFAHKYDVPVLTFVQLNREGEVAQSDRITWLCSSYTKFKRKTPEEIAEDGVENGNRKLIPSFCRYGEGMEDDGTDYINILMNGATCTLKEGKTKNQLGTRKGTEIEYDDGQQDEDFG